MRKRKRIRLAYACDCAGDSQPGRPGVLGSGTDQLRGVVQSWTGEPQPSCPWRALRDPFVGRVLDAYPWFESGQIATKYPRISHRLMEGIDFYHRAVSICQSKQMELDREQAKKR